MGHVRATVAIGLFAWGLHARTSSADPAPYCIGEYSKDLAALSPHARDIEAATVSYSYAVRTTATYECVSYGGDGNLKKTRVDRARVRHRVRLSPRRLRHAAAHQRARRRVARGDRRRSRRRRRAGRLQARRRRAQDRRRRSRRLRCRRHPARRASSSIRRSTSRSCARTPSSRSCRGGSARAPPLVARDAVEVKGFPLGEFQATNVGKVISAYDHDDQGDWNHDDFVVDALLTSGGSGSPVLAVSCKTGEFELVGIFHARYNSASALNVVVAIDQVRDLMTTLKRRAHADARSGARARRGGAGAPRRRGPQRFRSAVLRGRLADRVGPGARRRHARVRGVPERLPEDDATAPRDRGSRGRRWEGVRSCGIDLPGWQCWTSTLLAGGRRRRQSGPARSCARALANRCTRGIRVPNRSANGGGFTRRIRAQREAEARARTDARRAAGRHPGNRGSGGTRRGAIEWTCSRPRRARGGFYDDDDDSFDQWEELMRLILMILLVAAGAANRWRFKARARSRSGYGTDGRGAEATAARRGPRQQDRDPREDPVRLRQGHDQAGLVRSDERDRGRSSPRIRRSSGSGSRATRARRAMPTTTRSSPTIAPSR